MDNTQLTRDTFIEFGRRGGRKSGSQRYRSLLVPGLISTAAGISHAHRARGLDPKARERIKVEAS